MLNLFNKKTQAKLNFFPNIDKDLTVYKNNNNLVYSEEISDLNHKKEKIGETRHYPPATKEWVNSIYSFNKNYTKTLPATDSIVNRLIKSYLSLFPLNKGKKSKRIQLRFKRLSLNTILVSKAEMKHTSNKVIITVYMYNKNKKFLFYKLKNLYKTFLFSIFKGFNGDSQKEKPKKLLNKPNSNLELSRLNKKTFNVNKLGKTIKTNKLNTKTIKTKRFGKVSNLPLVNYKKISNYLNFTNYTKKRLSLFISNINETNLKNKYLTLAKKYSSVLSKYRLYTADNGNYHHLSSINLGLNTENSYYTSKFYKILKSKYSDYSIDSNNTSATKIDNIVDRVKGYNDQKSILNSSNSIITKNRKPIGLMQKIKSFYKSFVLDSVGFNLNIENKNMVYSAISMDSNNEINNEENKEESYLSRILKNSGLAKSSVIKRKLNAISQKSLKLIKKSRKFNNFLIKSLKWNNKHLINYENKYNQNFMKKAYKKELLYMYYVKMLALNNNKFKSWFLLGLKKVISNIYNKKVEFNFVNLKYLHLNSDIFSESIAIKLKNRQNRLLSVLKKALTLVKISSINKKAQLTLSPGSKAIFNNKSKSLALAFAKATGMNTLASNVNYNSDRLHVLLNNLFYGYTANTTNLLQSENLNLTQKNILDSIKHKAVFGVRLEAAGRLSKRLIASRSVFKLKYKGSLKNIDSSYNNQSSVILRGNLKSNVQYTKISNKTRNGSFGLKGWVSGY